MILDDKLYSAKINYFLGIFLFTLGILVIYYNNQLYNRTINILLIIIIINGFINMTKALVKKNYKIYFSYFLINMVFAIIFLCLPNVPRMFFPIMFSSYIILFNFAKIILFSINLKNNLKVNIFNVFNIIFNTIIGYLILRFPLKYLNILLIIVGIYLLILGIYFIGYAITLSIPVKYKNKFKKMIHIPIPVFIESFIPYTFLSQINKLLSVESEKNDNKVLLNAEDYLEVFVHVSDKGLNRIGHTDFAYKDKVFSYGNYDPLSYKLFKSIGDGVLFTTKRDKYLDYCIKTVNKTIFGFKVALNQKQKEQLESKIDSIYTNLIPWKPAYHKYRSDRNDDYASKLYKATNAKMYKFKKGKFKTYFVFGSSCCDMVNELIGYLGIDVLKMNGLICPGMYFDCLNREYAQSTGIVLSRTVYTDITLDEYAKDDIVL